MQDKFDKILKDKLGELNPEFNPDHWADMEARLDGRGKKAFGWWSLSAVLLAFLTAGALGYYFLQSGSQGNETLTKGDQVNAVEQKRSNSETSTQNDAQIDPLSSSAQLPSAQQSEITRKKAGSQLASEDKTSSLEKSQTDNTIGTQNQNPISSNVNASGKVEETPVDKESGTAQTAKNSSENQYLKTSPSSILNSGFSLTNNVVAKRDLPFTTASLNTIEIEKIKPSNETNQNLTQVTTDDEFQLPKYKAIEVYVSPEVSISESFIDNTRFSEPGYSIGLTTELVYKNVVGLSTGLLFTNINYGTKNVICQDNARYVCPLAYRSNIKALEIPIDLRLNILHSKRWRFFISTGISNFVKLDESFGYDLPLQDTIPAQLPPSRNVPFNQTTSGVQSPQDLYAETSTDFSLSDVKRFHLAYRAAIGAEYRISARMSLTLQPQFGFSIKKVGIQDKRLYSYGARGKINFIF